MKKTVKLGKTVYAVEVSEDEVVAEATTYPIPRAGNCYVDGWIIELGYSKGWAKVRRYYEGHGYARFGSMEEAGTLSTGYARKGTAQSFREQIEKELEEAEDQTPDVKRLYDKIVKFVRTHIDEWLEED